MDRTALRPVEQIRALVKWIGEGRKLTQTGRVTLGDARVLVELLDTGDVIDPKIGSRVFKTPTSAELIGLTSLVEWAKAAGLLRVAKGRIIAVKKHARLLDDPARLRAALFDALAGHNFIVDTGYGYETLVVVDYKRTFDTIAMLLYSHARRLSVAEIAEAVWEAIEPRWQTGDLTAAQAHRWRKENDHDVREVFEALASLGTVILDGDTVELTDTGRADLTRRRGEPVPGAQIWRLRVELCDVENPEVWRSIDVAPALTLDRLHKAIQAAMGWQDSHLHTFTADDGTDYGPYDFLDDRPIRKEKMAAISEILAPNREVRYTYDFGDDWHHRITLELTTTAQQGRAYPYCEGGAGACPAEDSGGPHGWDNVKAAIADPRSEAHTFYLSWLGLSDPAQFDRNAFDLDAANKRLRALA